MKNKKERSGGAARARAGVVLYSVAALFAAAGLADATYLTVIALTGETVACGGSAACHEVLGSSYARVAGIPVAVFGVAGYFSAFSCAVFAAFNYARAQKLFAVAVSALFAATLWFLYVPWQSLRALSLRKLLPL
ncbi:MAG: hypothetical protein LC627_04450 [Verrucomicrobiaceae bacterium]|nr:hypothetical protein [Verrucomicrobiaceae bacterium]